MLLFEVECPITRETSLWPKRLAYEVGIAQALSRKHGISMEDIWTMAKVTRELGEDWFEDSLEFQELLIQTTCDQERLRLSHEGLIDLGIVELSEIYWNAHRMLVLCWEHERDPAKRAKIEGYLAEMEAAHQRNIEFAMPILHPQVKKMLKMS